VDQRISGSAGDGAPTEEPWPDTSIARRQRPAPEGNWRVPCSCLCVKHPWFPTACACAFPPRSCFPSFARRSVLFGKSGKPRRALLLLLPPPGPVRVAKPSRPGLGAQRPTAWAPRVAFTEPLGLKKRRSARCPRVTARVHLRPQSHRSGQ
jgi:hypothetical protein